MAGLTIEFTNAATQRRRYRFEQRSAGGWWRVEEEFNEGSWRAVGKEVVADVVIEADAEIADTVGDEHGETGVIGP